MVYNITAIIKLGKVTTITFPEWVGTVTVFTDKELWYDHESNPVKSGDVDKQVIGFSDFKLGGFIPANVPTDLQLMCDCRTIKLITDVSRAKARIVLKG